MPRCYEHLENFQEDTFSGVILVYNSCFEQSAGNFTNNRTLPPVFF